MRVAVFVLWNVVPPVVVPQTETRYVCGEATTIVAGITKIKRRVLPITVATDCACVRTAVEGAGPCSDIVT